MDTKDIILKINTRQIDKNDELSEDKIEFITEGRAYRKNGTTYYVYEETEMSGMAGVTTTLKVSDEGTVKMKRYGHDVMMDTVMEFEKGRHFYSMYETPYGNIQMEILTNKVVNDIKGESMTGSLYIDYEMSLKGLSEARNLLNIEVTDAQHSV